MVVEAAAVAPGHHTHQVQDQEVVPLATHTLVAGTVVSMEPLPTMDSPHITEELILISTITVLALLAILRITSALMKQRLI